jgi:hypothetical protein
MGVSVGLMALAFAACRSRPSIDLEAARALVGDWELVFRSTPNRLTGEPAIEISGTVAFLANRDAVRVADFSGVPLNVGVHDLRLGAIAPGLSPKGLPEVVGSAIGDSAILVFGPGTPQPIELRGHLVPDSIFGRWTAYQRAGASTAGTFVMRRR